LRIPRSERQQLSEISVEPFTESYRGLQEAFAALAQAQEVADYQSIGVRCREALLSFIDGAQLVVPWTSEKEKPKKADLNAWTEHICSVILSGASHEHRRHLFKTQLEGAWKFANWLTHAKSSHWHDAEAAVETTETAITLCVSAVIRIVRGVPEHCPVCGSQRLSPERGHIRGASDVEWERPTCDKCGWTGEPVRLQFSKTRPEAASRSPEGDCIIPKTPLRKLNHPRSKK
jgi:hypothetical protein